MSRHRDTLTISKAQTLDLAIISILAKTAPPAHIQWVIHDAGQLCAGFGLDDSTPPAIAIWPQNNMLLTLFATDFLCANTQNFAAMDIHLPHTRKPYTPQNYIQQVLWQALKDPMIEALLDRGFFPVYKKAHTKHDRHLSAHALSHHTINQPTLHLRKQW